MPRSNFLIALAIVLAAVPTAKAAQLCNGITSTAPSKVTPLCSATWEMKATCTGEDLWDKWKVSGRTKRPDAFIKPFENLPIDVVGYELVNMSQRSASEFANAWFMIGSGMTGYPDTMLWLGPGELHAKNMFQAGFGQHWPSAASASKERLQDIIDLHGFCTGGKDVTIYLTVYYSPLDADDAEPVSR
jgi:hypothetical protein